MATLAGVARPETGARGVPTATRVFLPICVEKRDNFEPTAAKLSQAQNYSETDLFISCENHKFFGC